MNQIGSDTLNDLSFISDCDIWSVLTNKNLTVNGLTTSNNLTVPGYATVSGLLTAGQTIVCNVLKSSGQGGVNILKSDGGIAVKVFDAGVAQFYSNVIADANVTVGGDLTVSGYLNYKPYCAGQITGDSIAFQSGLKIATLSRANGTGGIYNFTMPSAHPNGTNYLVFAQIKTGATAATFSFCSTNVTSSSTFNIWDRSSSMSAMNGDFYFYTVP